MSFVTESHKVMKPGAIGALGGASLIALSLVLAPALAAPTKEKKKERPAAALNLVSAFTPAVSDPRLAAAFARRGVQSSSFRFTPSPASADQSKAVLVTVRARGAGPEAVRTGGASGTAISAITPSAYNLGVAVGWKRFALSGDMARVENDILPGQREAAEVGVSYAGKKFGGRLQVGAERSDGAQRLVAADSAYSLDVGGSYSIARNVALTGGVRYKIQRDRLQPLSDERRDSQAVYIGTAFRF
jgi:hypothetical protein